MAVYYNEFDPYCAQWLRNLMAASLIPLGFVDERDIRDVKPYELAPYTQCHFFAGIGGWPLALAMADWPSGRPVWTGSCPCQPFSLAGKRGGTADDRHLWPAFRYLIAHARPATVFGEQVASKDGRAWLGAVRSDLEALGYGVGAADLCAAGVGAPHIRQRLFFVADTQSQHDGCGASGSRRRTEFANGGHVGELADSIRPRLEVERIEPARDQCAPVERGGAVGGMGVSDSARSPARHETAATNGHRHPAVSADWNDLVWLPCTDGKARPTQPDLFPLAHGVSARVSKLRAIGNAIVPQVAAEFILAAMESL